MHLRDWMGCLGLLLTFLKPLWGWIIVVWVLTGQNRWASVGIFCLMISDIFDGIIFRKSTLAMQQRFGLLRRALDAVGDRVCIYLIFAAMIKANHLPFYVYGIELVRELALISIIAYSWAMSNPIKEPNLPSRVATFLSGLTAIAWLNSQPKLSIFLMCLVVPLGLIGLRKYYRTMIG